ncbi:MAG: hypothetical protein AAFY08_14635 [Planctomycetota bacterium]
MAKHTRRRMPKLSYTESQGIGYYASFRDPITNTPRRKRFGMVDEADAKRLYTRWLADHMGGSTESSPQGRPSPTPRKPAVQSPSIASPSNAAPGSLIAVADSLLRLEEARTRREGEPKAPGTITHRVFLDRKKHLQDFLRHLNDRHGQGSLTRMSLADLSMEDVESYNLQIVRSGYSGSQVAKRMQIIKSLVNRAGRPEFGQQALTWNWDSMDRHFGKATEKRLLPTLPQLRSVLPMCDMRERAIVWMAIGLGFGQRDLAVIRTGQIDEQSYDLRRGKTGIERFGETPPLVWGVMAEYLRRSPRETGSLLFTTRTGQPLVHGRSDSIGQWWSDLRLKIGETSKTMGGFYTLRHLGATEFGSREGTSIGAMKRWLGHSASSDMADVYMKPVAPEQRELIEWVRRSLASRSVEHAT